MSLSQQLRQTIEDEIVAGALPVGARLDEAQLAARFGVSRTPIREALLQLAAGGLVEARPRRGMTVSAPQAQDLLAMFETMAEIEASCARLAARRLTAAGQADLEAALSACEVAAKAEDTSGYHAENFAFHAAVYRASRNAFLAERALSLHRRLAPHRRLLLRARPRVTRSAIDHGLIVAAITAGDEVGAAERLREHVLVQADRFADLFSELRSPDAA